MEQPIPLSKRVSEQEYLRLERASAERHEFHDGLIVAMAGGKEPHSRVISNMNRLLGNHLVRTGCRVYEGNMKVRTARPTKYHYPDVFVICGPTQFAPEDDEQTAVINPKLIVEVLSKSTAAYDRGDKFLAYMSLDSFEEYVLAWQTEPRIETRRRQPDGNWLMSFAVGLDAVVKLTSLGIEIPLSEIYVDVDLPPGAASAE